VPGFLPGHVILGARAAGLSTRTCLSNVAQSQGSQSASGSSSFNSEQIYLKGPRESHHCAPPWAQWAQHGGLAGLSLFPGAANW
jgi:hypothetical protein